MKAKVKSSKLKKSLGYIVRSIQVKPNIPVLSNVLIELKNGNLILSSTNLEMSVKVWIPAMIDIEGSTTVSAKSVYDYVSALSDENVDILMENNQLKVFTNRYKAYFNTLPSDDFPVLPNPSDVKFFSFDSRLFSKSLQKVFFAVSNDFSPSRMAYTGVFIEKSLDKTDSVSIVGLDTFRLSLIDMNVTFYDDSFENKSLLIPAKNLIEIVKILSDIEEEFLVEVYRSSNQGQIIFKNDNIEISVRLLDAQYPNYRQIIPTDNKFQLLAKRQDLENAFKIMNAFTRDPSTFKILFDVVYPDRKLILSSLENEIGRNELLVDLDPESTVPEQGIKMAFFLKNFFEAVNHIDGDTVVIKGNNATSPTVIKDTSDNNFIHLLMPARRDV